jgi:hypothetical protein
MGSHGRQQDTNQRGAANDIRVISGHERFLRGVAGSFGPTKGISRDQGRMMARGRVQTVGRFGRIATCDSEATLAP